MVEKNQNLSKQMEKKLQTTISEYEEKLALL